MQKIKNIIKENIGLIGLIPIYLYFSNLLKYSQNIPHWDDYAIIHFVNKFHATDGFWEKLQLIFAQHNEHRIAITRIVALLITEINGNLNFQWMIVLGNLALVGILIVFIKFLKLNKLSINYIIPVCFLIFQLSIYENSYWGMASVQNFWVIFFVVVSIWQIARGKIPYVWAFFATFTSANGVVFVPFVGLLVFLWQKEKKKTVIWLVYSLFLILLYFLDYSKPIDSQPISIHFLDNINAGLALVGSIIDVDLYQIFSKRLLFSILTGLVFSIIILVSILFKYLAEKNLQKTNSFSFYFLLGILIFLIGTSFVTAISRFHYGFYVFLTSKYKIYSILICCSLYLLLLINFIYIGKKIILGLVSIFAILLYLNSYFYSLGEIKNYHKSEIASYFNGWLQAGNKPQMIQNSAYQYQKTIFDGSINEIPKDKTQKLGTVNLTDSLLIVDNPDFELLGTKPADGAYLEFVAEGKKYIFATKQARMNSKKAFYFKNGNFYSKGFTCQVPLTEFSTDNYFINILENKDGVLNRIPTNYYIEIEGIQIKKPIQNW